MKTKSHKGYAVKRRESPDTIAIEDENGNLYCVEQNLVQSSRIKFGDRVSFYPELGEAKNVFNLSRSCSIKDILTSFYKTSKFLLTLYIAPIGRVSFTDFWILGLVPLYATQVIITDQILPEMAWRIPAQLYYTISSINLLVFAWCKLSLAIKRCHDVGYSTFFTLICAMIGSTLAFERWILFGYPLDLGHRLEFNWDDLLLLLKLNSLEGNVFLLILAYKALLRPGNTQANRYGPPSRSVILDALRNMLRIIRNAIDRRNSFG